MKFVLSSFTDSYLRTSTYFKFSTWFNFDKFVSCKIRHLWNIQTKITCGFYCHVLRERDFASLVNAAAVTEKLIDGSDDPPGLLERGLFLRLGLCQRSSREILEFIFNLGYR